MFEFHYMELVPIVEMMQGCKGLEFTDIIITDYENNEVYTLKELHEIIYN